MRTTIFTIGYFYLEFRFEAFDMPVFILSMLFTLCAMTDVLEIVSRIHKLSRKPK